MFRKNYQERNRYAEENLRTLIAYRKGLPAHNNKEKDMAQLVFNAATVEPATMGGSSLPLSGSDGWPVVITASEIKQAKSGGNNGYLELTLSVIDGEYRGESGAYRLNLYHSSEKTVEIAYRQLSAVCHVTGAVNMVDTQQLHNLPFRAVVGLQKRNANWKDGDPEYTEVKGVLHSDGSQPGKSKGGSAPGPSAPPQAPTQPTPTPTPQPEQQASPPAWGGGAPAGSSAPPWAQPK